MAELSFEDIWMTPEPWETRATPLPSQPIDGAREATSWRKARFASRDSISAMATLGSVMTMAAFGAGALFSLHSLAHSGEPLNSSLEVAELQATAAPAAGLTRISTPTPSIHAPTSFFPPTWTPVATASQTPTATPIVTSTPSPAARVPRATARPHPPPRVVLYPFPVPPPSMRNERTMVPPSPSKQNSGPTPRDEIPATTTTSAGATSSGSLTAPRQAADVPSDDLLGSRQ
jgi:hypothetical protein